MEKELIKKFHILKQIKLDESWKKQNRDFLLSQISNTEDEIVIRKNFFSFVHQPAWALFMITLFVVVGGGFTAQASKNIKPGNSLFIARLISEKARVAITFNKEEKAKLGMEFAKTHAKEITEIMSNPNFNHGDEEKVKKLTKDFKRELGTVKEKMVEINKIKEDKLTPETGDDEAMVGIGSKIIVADSGKTNNGIEFFDSDINNNGNDVLKDATSEKNLEDENKDIDQKATSSEETKEVEIVTATATIEYALENAERNFSEKNFEEAKNILEKMDEIIEEVDKGEVKGTSTDNTDNNSSSSVEIEK